MHRPGRWPTYAAVLLGALCASSVFAEDLLQVVRDAKGFDAQYAGARQAVAAGREKLVQGRSGNLEADSSSCSYRGMRG